MMIAVAGLGVVYAWTVSLLVVPFVGGRVLSCDAYFDVFTACF